MNVIALTGRLGGDPEAKEGKTAIAKFAVAQNRRRGNEEITDWFDCTAFGKQAEFVLEYLKKGALVGITGRVVVDTWKDKDTGKNRKAYQIEVSHVDSLERKAASDGDGF